MDPATTRFFELPELVAHLAQHLDRTGISRLMRTCRQMQALCTSAHYFHVTACFDLNKEHHLFSCPKSIMAFSRNVHHVRQLNLGCYSIVYYVNCVIASLDQPATRQQDASTVNAIEVQPALSRPAWLAPAGPSLCTVYPIPPMTMLTKLNFGFVDQDVYAYKKCPYYIPSYRDPKATLTQVCWIIDSNPNLLDLKLTSVFLKDRRDACLLATTLFRLQRLRTLYFEFFLWNHTTLLLMPKVGIDFLYTCPPNLWKLTIASFEDGDYDDETFATEYNESESGTLQSWEKPDEECGLSTMMPRRQEPLLDLRELQLGLLGEDLSRDDLQSILQQCPNLTTFQMPRLREIGDLQQLAGEIAQWCPRLNNLSNNGFDSGDEETRELLIWVLKALSPQQVTRFIWSGVPAGHIQGLDDVGSIFRRHSSTLREIVVNVYKNFDSKTVQAILVGCNALERCEIHWPMYSDQRQLCLHLEDAIDVPWACTRMHELRLTIAIPERPLHRLSNNVEPYYNRRTSATLTIEETQQFRELESFYRQLGKLTELRRLDLRALYFDPTGERDASWTFRTMSFPGMLSLGSEKTGRPGYLHLLGGLTKLQKLIGSVAADTKETRVTVGMDEVEWMDKHWPALEEGGFFTESPIAPNPFCWFLEQRRQKGQKLVVCACH